MRVFVAIEISENKIYQLIKQMQSKISLDAKPIKAENLHFTLQFLGEISEELSQKVILALQNIEFSSFSINMKGLGVFPKSKSPRVIWVGTDENGGRELTNLAEKVQNALKPLGLYADKPFKPHLTIFRIKNKSKDVKKEVEKEAKAELGTLYVDRIKLKKSKLLPNGPIYSDLMEVKAKS